MGRPGPVYETIFPLLICSEVKVKTMFPSPPSGEFYKLYVWYKDGILSLTSVTEVGQKY